MTFTFSCNDRPFPEITIKRGIGAGGFGEVYFALTDGGREIAIKFIRNNQDTELRGVSQCLNFKHPNLVALFDIRKDDRGNPWVIMEYVKGDCLNTLLEKHPNGLPIDLACQWFQGLAKGIDYLHDQGVVHRDLKPGNVFIEDGTVKVGDYGLCKFISSSQREGQTGSVGTVYYMAPEIKTGNYYKQIDIYAAGVMFYEMLTGRVPFSGETAAEVLMKHMMDQPDFGNVPKAFVPVLHRALAKNPAHRHKTIMELARDIEAAASSKVVSVPAVHNTTPFSASPKQSEGPAALEIPIHKQPVVTIEHASTEKSTSEGSDKPIAGGKVFELSQMLIKSSLMALLFSVLWSVVLGRTTLPIVGEYFFVGLAASWAVLIPASLWTKRATESMGRRVCLMSFGLLVGFLTLWLEGHDLSALVTNQAQASPVVVVPEPSTDPLDEDSTVPHLIETTSEKTILACYLGYFGLAFFGLRWWHLADRKRSRRFSMFSVLAAGLLGFVLLLLLWPAPQRTQASLGVVSLVMASVIVQLVSPWQKPQIRQPQKFRLGTA
ncbi:MAG: serine/threonine-protein kinase [Gemmataceae bacterium]